MARTILRSSHSAAALVRLHRSERPRGGIRPPYKYSYEYHPGLLQESSSTSTCPYSYHLLPQRRLLPPTTRLHHLSSYSMLNCLEHCKARPYRSGYLNDRYHFSSYNACPDSLGSSYACSNHLCSCRYDPRDACCYYSMPAPAATTPTTLLLPLPRLLRCLLLLLRLRRLLLLPRPPLRRCCRYPGSYDACSAPPTPTTTPAPAATTPTTPLLPLPRLLRCLLLLLRLRRLLLLLRLRRLLPPLRPPLRCCRHYPGSHNACCHYPGSHDACSSYSDYAACSRRYDPHYAAAAATQAPTMPAPPTPTTTPAPAATTPTTLLLPLPRLSQRLLPLPRLPRRLLLLLRRRPALPPWLPQCLLLPLRLRPQLLPLRPPLRRCCHNPGSHDDRRCHLGSHDACPCHQDAYSCRYDPHYAAAVTQAPTTPAPPAPTTRGAATSAPMTPAPVTKTRTPAATTPTTPLLPPRLP